MAIGMNPSWKENVSFILVEPREPGNVGAAGRALLNMGFRNLELVNPVRFRTREARWMACQGYEILKQARVHATFDGAIRDKHLIVGTTRRLGRRRGLILPLRDGVERIVSVAAKNKVAIVFGRERNGLTNSEVNRCGLLVTIPSDAAAPSLNLAQSVMLVAYELTQGVWGASLPKLVTQEKLQHFYGRVESTLKLLEYIPRGNTDLEAKIMKNLARLIARAGLTEWEMNMLYGICAQVERKICR